jgi:hypothetical protein
MQHYQRSDSSNDCTMCMFHTLHVLIESDALIRLQWLSIKNDAQSTHQSITKHECKSRWLAKESRTSSG